MCLLLFVTHKLSSWDWWVKSSLGYFSFFSDELFLWWRLFAVTILILPSVFKRRFQYLYSDFDVTSGIMLSLQISCPRHTWPSGRSFNCSHFQSAVNRHSFSHYMVRGWDLCNGRPGPQLRIQGFWRVVQIVRAFSFIWGCEVCRWEKECN